MYSSEKKISRRNFLKKAGASTSVAVATFALPSGAIAKEEQKNDIMQEYWKRKQEKYQAIENKLRKRYKAFDGPPKYIYRGTDWTDDRATFYAPLQEECKYLPEFHSIFTEGTGGLYF